MFVLSANMKFKLISFFSFDLDWFIKFIKFIYNMFQLESKLKFYRGIPNSNACTKLQRKISFIPAMLLDTNLSVALQWTRDQTEDKVETSREAFCDKLIVLYYRCPADGKRRSYLNKRFY